MAKDELKNKGLELEKELEEKLSSFRVQEDENRAKKLAENLGLSYANLKSYPIDPNAVYLIKEEEARNGGLAAISRAGKTIRVAVTNPQDQRTQSAVSNLKDSGFEVTIVVVSPLSLSKAWEKYAEKKENIKEPEGVINIKETETTQLTEEIKSLADLKDKLAKMTTTKALDIMIAGALKIKASDIHFEPEEKTIRLRYRLDGMLSDVAGFSPDSYPQILNRIKLLSGLKINVHNSPQDGRFTIRQEKLDIEVRVSILPGAYGENIVMRILDPTAIKQKIEDLGMREDILEAIKTLLKKTTGAILTTGPTGSGKTTTLYAFVKYVNSPDVKIITVEDPVEYHVEGISQTQVNPKAGYTFASGLRSIVRQDPDVILIGEIRDGETAEIAMQAALTGHLVFSTLHTNSAAGAIPRLIDLGVRPVSIAPAINAAMAQRLVRQLCPDCKKKEKIKKEDLELFKKYLSNLPKTISIPEIKEDMEIYYPEKCDKCNMTGYRGRIGIYEIFEVDSEMEKIILKSPSVSEMEEAMQKRGATTLLQDGLIKAASGVTSVEEVMRVVGE